MRTLALIGLLACTTPVAAVEFEFSSFLGGSDADRLDDIAIEPDGDVWLVGSTRSSDFPTPGGQQTSLGVAPDGFLVRIDAGNTLAYGRYVNGADDEKFRAVALGADGRLHVLASRDINESVDCVVLRISAAGEIERSDVLAATSASENCSDIAVDAAGNAYVVGLTEALDFPLSGNAAFTTRQGSEAGFLAVLGPDGNLVHSTLLGGAGDRIGSTLLLEGGVATIAGLEVVNGSSDAFVMRIDLDAAFPGPGEYVRSIAGTGFEHANDLVAGDAGSVFLIGSSDSTDLPTTPGTYKPVAPGGVACMLARIDADGTLGLLTYTDRQTTCESGVRIGNELWVGGQKAMGLIVPQLMRLDLGLSSVRTSLTLLGGPNDLGVGGVDLLATRNGRLLIAGNTGQTSHPLTPDAFDVTAEEEEAYFSELLPDPDLVFGDGFGRP